MNNAICTATGDWNTTTLFNNDQEVSALELYVEINAGEDDGYGNIRAGGVMGDSQITAFVREAAQPAEQFPILPGRFEVNTPQGQLVIENASLSGVDAPEATQVFYQGPATSNQLTNVTRGVINVLVNINFDTNVQQVTLSLYKHHTFSFLFGNDEIHNITML